MHPLNGQRDGDCSSDALQKCARLLQARSGLMAVCMLAMSTAFVHAAPPESEPDWPVSSDRTRAAFASFAGYPSTGAGNFSQPPLVPRPASFGEPTRYGIPGQRATVASRELPPIDETTPFSFDEVSSPVVTEYVVPADERWRFISLPGSLIYKSYLAGIREPRLGTTFSSGRSGIHGNDWLQEGFLGGRVGIFRYGTPDSFMPQGWQVDAEGMASVRLNYSDELDVQATDYRAGLPITYGCGNYQLKFAYYHISSHLGDEFLLKNPTFDRLNFLRDVLVFGYAYNFNPSLRGYGEFGWAFNTEVSRPIEFQFGLDWAPGFPTGPRGGPFAAVNAHLRQELNYGGNFVFQVGWAWRSNEGARLIRTGFQYLTGGSGQYSFYQYFEEQFGWGLWYDF